MRIELISGCEGYCITVNDTRIAGPKPWGGGKVVKSWEVDPYSLYELTKICDKELRKLLGTDEKSYAEEFIANHYFV